jgi:hypothetical protein
VRYGAGMRRPSLPTSHPNAVSDGRNAAPTQPVRQRLGWLVVGLALSLVGGGIGFAQVDGEPWTRSVRAYEVARTAEAVVALATDAAVDPTGVLALDAGGTLTHVGPAGTTRWAGGLIGEHLTVCDDAVLAVDGSGRLVAFPRKPAPGSFASAGSRARTGPPVARFHRPACVSNRAGAAWVAVVAPGGDAIVLLDATLRETARTALAVLPDAELSLVSVPDRRSPTPVDDATPPGRDRWALAVLTDPTQRIRDGRLGDEVEAASVTVLGLPDLVELGRHEVAENEVILERRSLGWHVGSAFGLLLTVDDRRNGARLRVLLWRNGQLVPVARSRATGDAERWLALIAVVGARVYAVESPHQGGPLVRFELPAEKWSVAPVGDSGHGRDSGHDREGGRSEPPTPRPTTLRANAVDLDVTAHVDGERSLDRAAWVARSSAGVDLLVLTRADLSGVRWVRCGPEGCGVALDVDVPGGASSGLAVAGPRMAWVGGADGRVWRLNGPGLTAPSEGAR